MIPDQTAVWNKKHERGDHEGLRNVPSPLSLLAEPSFPRRSNILELGCGVGRDSTYFVSKGHSVTATDSSPVVIKQDKEHFANSGVEFNVLDMRQNLPYDPGSFDVVYANLALHYYSEHQTRNIIENISRVLRAGGILAFSCKSEDLNRTEGAKELEKNVFVDSKNHALHLFSIPYAQKLLEGIFEITLLDEVEEEYNGQKSKIVRCIGKNWGEL